MPEIFSGSDTTTPKKSTSVRSSLMGSAPKAQVKQETEKDMAPDKTISQKVEKAEVSFQAAKEQKQHRKVDEYSEVMRQEVSCDNPLAAFAPKPKNVSFSSQAETEHVILMLRQHPITQLPWIATIIVLAFVPFLFALSPVLSFFPGNFTMAFTIFWYLILTGLSLEQFLKWYYNVYIITDERIIDVDFISLIYTNVSSAKTDNIEDVTATSGGFFAALFDFGKVTVQTAAEKREFEFDNIPQPSKVVSLINELLLEEEKEKIEGRVS